MPVVAIPALSPINPAPGNPARDQYRSSIWVGLNGYRSYPHMTMPQIGTWQHVIPGAKGSTIDTAAWWQWWSRDEVTPIVKFKNVKVGTNDRILSGLILVSEDEVVFYLKNQTTGIFTWVLVQAPPQSEPLGLTAEWIVERPTTPGFTWPWRMPDFTDITFDHCHTFAGPTIVCAQQVRNLERARFIRMQERFPDPYRSSFISVPERLGTTRLAVRYQRENFSDPTVHVA